MSGSNEDVQVESLIWSTDGYPLGQFVEDYPLPQVVSIEEGYYGESEFATFGAGQVLILHALRSIKKLVCEDCQGKPFTIPLDCSVMVHVSPLDRDGKYVNIQANQLIYVFPRFKYLRVLEGYYNSENEDESFEADDILEIIAIDEERRIVRCENVVIKQTLSFSFQCDASFVPLLDCMEYTPAGVKEKFGIPAKVYFKIADDDLSKSLSILGRSILLGEFSETSVISSTVGGKAEGKVCLLRKDLDLSVRVAEGFISGEEKYKEVVKMLDKNARQTNLSDFEHFDVDYHNRDVKKNTPMTEYFLVHEPSEEVIRKYAEFRLKLFKNKAQPSLPPRPSQFKANNESAVTSFHVGLAKSCSMNTHGAMNPGGLLDATKEDSSDGGEYEDVGSTEFARENAFDLHRQFHSSRVKFPRENPPLDPMKLDLPKVPWEVGNDKALKTGQLRSDNFDENQYNLPSSPRDSLSLPLNSSARFHSTVPTSPSNPNKPPNSIFPPPKLVFPANNNHRTHERASENYYEPLGCTSLRRPAQTAVAKPKSTKPELETRKPSNLRSKLKTFSVEKLPLTSKLFASRVSLSPFTTHPKTEHPSEAEYSRSRKKRCSEDLDKQTELTQGQKEVVYEKMEKVVSIKDGSKTSPLSTTRETWRNSPVHRTEIYARKSRLPDDLSILTIKDVSALLVDLHMEQYVETFEEEMIDGDMLKSMDLEALLSLNIDLFHSKKLLKFIKGWRPT